MNAPEPPPATEQVEPAAAPVGAAALRPRDAAALAQFPPVRRAHTYTASWYHNATFVFPLLAAAVAAVVYLASGSGEAGGAALFFLVVTAAMLPVVFLTWQRQTTAVLLHDEGVTALHSGREQLTIKWEDLHSVRKVDTMGNLRWYLDGPNEAHIVIEGEISEREALLEAARQELDRRRQAEQEPPPAQA